MTARGQRLRRILHLRVQMHDAAALDLRVANGTLQAAEEALRQVNLAAQGSRDRLRVTKSERATDDWLMSCADAEFYKLSAAAHAKRIAEATVVMNAAAGREMDARRERRQMEVTLAAVWREDTYAAARAEQKRLDESSRHILALSHPTSKSLAKPI